MNSQTEQKTRTLASLTEAEAVEVAKIIACDMRKFKVADRGPHWEVTFGNKGWWRVCINKKDFGLHLSTEDYRPDVGVTVNIHPKHSVRAYLYLQSIGIDVPLD